MRTKPLFGRGKLQKMLLVTRIGLLCILAFNITAAANVFSQAFNLKMKNVTLEEVLLEIQKKSSFDIICNSEQISNIKNLSVKVENANVEEILKQCLKGTVLSYEIVDNTVVIYEQKRLEAAPQQTKIVIKGLILEADGRPARCARQRSGYTVRRTIIPTRENPRETVKPNSATYEQGFAYGKENSYSYTIIHCPAMNPVRSSAHRLHR